MMPHKFVKHKYPYSGGSDINIFDTNAAIDTSQKIIDNVREMLKGCRGYLPYVGGKYKLIIKTTVQPQSH